MANTYKDRRTLFGPAARMLKREERVQGKQAKQRAREQSRHDLRREAEEALDYTREVVRG